MKRDKRLNMVINVHCVHFDEKGNNSDTLSLISPDLSYIFRFMELAGTPILPLHSYSEIFHMTRINYFTIYKLLYSSLKLKCASTSTFTF